MGQTRVRTGDDIETVRRYFDLYARGLTEPLLALLHPEVRMVPIAADGRVLVGRDEVRRFFSEMNRDGVSTEPYACRFVSHGERVVAIGSLRQRRFSELRDRTGAWVFEVRDGVVHSIEGYASPADAIEAAAAPAALPS